jgi:glutamate-ammonia-ligase adenylyltransferase
MFVDRIENGPISSDPELSRIGMERWRDQVSLMPEAERTDTALMIADHPAGRRLLEGIFSASPFLTNLSLREQATATRCLIEGPDAVFPDLMQVLADVDAPALATEALMRQLRVIKRQTALTIALADLCQVWSVEQITDALTELADRTLTLSWRHALSVTVKSGKLPASGAEDPIEGSGLICLAMGKMGARELNYSSDIDLIVFFDNELEIYRDCDELQQGFVRATRLMVRLMEERTSDGYVFRTDLRLRPDAGATPLAVSTVAAENYYESLGQNWERAALIKARAVASDTHSAEIFLDRLRPFIWRRHLDFAAIQDIHSIKRQINAHKGGGTIAVEGHDLKLGRGGIREIEFFAQTQQLIWGGRDARLREITTRGALGALVEAGRVEAEVAEVLMAAYRFLRTVEHRVQMVADAQTHSLPEDPKELERLSAFLGYETIDRFRAELLAHLSTVAKHYAVLFKDSAPLSAPNDSAGSLVFTGVENDPETLKTISELGFDDPDSVATRIRAWHHGRYRATRSERARQILTELAPGLLVAFGAAAEPDEAFRRFDKFLEGLPSGVQVFSLFHANPELIDFLVEVMGMAPSLAQQLGNRPALFESLLTHDALQPLPGCANLLAELQRDLATARDYEDVLDITRRWINDRRFQIGVQIVRGHANPGQAGGTLSDIVDVAITALLPHVEEDFARLHGRVPDAGSPGLTLLALGKLGGRELTAGSDLDMVFLYDAALTTESDGEKPLMASAYFIRLAQRLLAALTAKTAEGGLFDVDMRLRPHGNKGPVATSIESFEKYHTEDGWTWEKMALTRTRLITGSDRLITRLQSYIADDLRRPRDQDALLRDVASMRQRIDREHRASHPWQVKYWRGGLVDVEFAAQYLQLRHAPEQDDVIHANTIGALENLQRIGALDAEDREALAGSLTLVRDIQGILRLTIDDRFDPATAPDALKLRLVEAAGVTDFAALEDLLRARMDAAYQVYQRLVETPAAALPTPDTA